MVQQVVGLPLVCFQPNTYVRYRHDFKEAQDYSKFAFRWGSQYFVATDPLGTAKRKHPQWCQARSEHDLVD
jgi:hypothetical protein